MTPFQYDIAVVGGGPGGYVAAIRATQLGARVVLIEKEALGGVCLNRGCIPSKAMIASAELLLKIRKAADFGIDGVAAPVVNLAQIQKRKNAIVTKLNLGIKFLLNSHQVAGVAGAARLTAPHTLQVGDQTITASKVILATGSTGGTLPKVTVDGEVVVDSDHVLNWDQAPQRLLIIGGGVIGCEFATLWHAFGSEVTIVEMAPRLLPTMDESVTSLLERSFKQRGIAVLTNQRLATLMREGDKAVATLENGQTLEADRVLVAVGRKPLTGGFGLEAVGIKQERGTVVVNEWLETSLLDHYAIGDMIGNYMLAHVASAEGIAAVEHALGKRKTPLAYHATPCPVFTIPELCGVGKTEAELKQAGIAYKVGRFPYAASGKALCEGSDEGQVVVYADEEGVILGAHLIGAHATDLCAEFALAVRHRLKAEAILETIHSHPTFSEILCEATEDLFGLAIHKAGKKR